MEFIIQISLTKSNKKPDQLRDQVVLLFIKTTSYAGGLSYAMRK
jgi:hypothetical protein